MSLPDNAPRTVALVGMPGAGKTLCAMHLQDRGFFQFRFGGIVENEVRRRGLAVNPQNERTVREEFRAQDGMAAIAMRALPHLQTGMHTHQTIIIDGLYSFSEYKLLREELGEDMVVIAIVAPRALRYQRLSQRPVRPLTGAEAFERDVAEIEKLEKGGPIAIADYFLHNDGDTRLIIQQLDELLDTLGVDA